MNDTGPIFVYGVVGSVYASQVKTTECLELSRVGTGGLGGRG